MATSPSPSSPPSAVPPPQSSTPSTPPPSSLTPSSPPPQRATPSPGRPSFSASQPRANSPTTTSVPSIAPTESPAADSTSPPSSSPSPPPQQPVASPTPPSTASPPPVSGSPPPPQNNAPPPPLPDPPQSSPPPPLPSPPTNSPPPSQNPPATTPTTPSPNPPAASPAPPSSNPPSISPPPRSDPPQKSPPPTARQPPQNSPPSPSSQPPQSTSPPPDSPPQNTPPSQSVPPSNSTEPSTFNPPPPLSPNSQPSPNSSAPPVIPVSPPPPSGVSPPSPSQLQVPPSGIRTHSPNAPSANGGISTGVAVGIGVVLGFILLGAIGAAAWCTSKRKKKVVGMPTSLSSSPNTDSSLIKTQRSPANTSRSASELLYSPSEPGGLGNSRPWFTYEALVEATNEFSEENLLGEGGFGSVYKGYLPDGQEVAVKQLKIGGGQGEREFKAEVEIISRIHHRHLVSLAGYCISENRRLLVYEYVSNNTLHFHLHGADRPVMNWETRVKVAAGAARGIAYLHEDCLPRIIHRDIKSANILLDKNFEARVSDFGLAKLAADANSHVTTRVMGTFGYMAPEYASSGKLTEKSDVFSFGVVLLELITGRKPVDTSQPLGEESLVEWARPQLSHALATEQFEDLVDPRLEKKYVDSEMFRMIEAAAACVRHSAAKRPSMGQVVRAFETMITADLANGMRVGESTIYNSAEQSAEIRLFRRMAFGSQDYSTDFFSQGSWNS